MGILREFFNGRILINCTVFSLFLSVLFMLRFIYIQHIPFFSQGALQAYIFFVILTFIVLRIFLFILYLLGRREERR